MYVYIGIKFKGRAINVSVAKILSRIVFKLLAAK